MKPTSILTKSIVALVGVALSASSASAADGDIALTFQLSTGGTNTFMVNLGQAYTYRNLSSNVFNIVNIGDGLTSAIGAGWQNNTSLYMGAVASNSSSNNTSTVTNGDTNRTMYVSAANTSLQSPSPRNSAAWTGLSNSNMTSGSTSILGVTGHIVGGLGTTLTETLAASGVDEANPFVTSTQQDTGYGLFGGGVQTVFTAGNLGSYAGITTVEAAVDLYRILAVTGKSGEVAGSLRSGNYQGTFVIDNGGSVSFLVNPTELVAVPEPTTTVASLLVGCVSFAMRRRRRVIA